VRERVDLREKVRVKKKEDDGGMGGEEWKRKKNGEVESEEGWRRGKGE